MKSPMRQQKTLEDSFNYPLDYDMFCAILTMFTPPAPSQDRAGFIFSLK